MGSVAPGGGSGEMSQRRKTVIAAIEGYNSWKIDKIMAPRHPDAIHEILPKTLERPVMNNTHYRSYFSAIMPYFHNFHVTINDLIEDPIQNKIAIWAKSTGSTEIGEYSNEYMLVFYLDQEGKQIVRSLEFVDSAVTMPYMVELGKYIREKKGSDGFEKRYNE
ncbi:uncharacterized protein PAC_10608 [Phialocephala subalpina]|uniref:SnoaL-like domain-containing protein n=1 Tax=Phialocephala subalpina TaxID=576137 RepID=A0A1L7X6T6_9HELO|nr:uncharacterized protein PAC_10608 [Phialocephala subalpina]